MTTTRTAYLPQHLPPLPAPLEIRKKPRKRLWFTHRKPPRTQTSDSPGPLDDIISEIARDIRRSPSFDPWEACPEFEDLFTWGILPWSVSHAPSERPLSVRKTRSSRSHTTSSASGSSFSYAMASAGSEDGGECGCHRPPVASRQTSHAVCVSSLLEVSAQPTRAAGSLTSRIVSFRKESRQQEDIVQQHTPAMDGDAESTSRSCRSHGLRKHFFSLSKRRA
ncbi:uncharacterized protein EI97DRAFT_309641 [Westerdykella ornata]|uniref:Uncharacterized protein n=1 Tax=Westerdykella ornata TaxID=318751 RepID=A0A6A6JLH7_WESOR|nr:uncharacterized protein EI97DRAFT_309641 [Westerdykella ornata]KAF2277104.1 hypothetical protein EI97DRAFT_309641 [Westerdykella ornata]